MPASRRRSSFSSVNSSSRGSSIANDGSNTSTAVAIANKGSASITSFFTLHDLISGEQDVSYISEFNVHRPKCKYNSPQTSQLRMFAPMYGEPSLVESVLKEKVHVAQIAPIRLSAAIRIQSTFRMFAQRSRFVFLRRQVVKAQSWVRGMLTRHGVLQRMKEQIYRSYVNTVFDYYATCIQACWRGYMVRHRETNKIDRCNTNITNFYGLKTYLQNAVRANKTVSKLSEEINASNEKTQMSERHRREEMLLSAATSQLHFALSTQSIKGVYNADVISRSLLRTSVKNTPSTNNGNTSDANIFYAESEDEEKGNEDDEQHINSVSAEIEALNEVCSENINSVSNVVRDENTVNETERIYTIENESKVSTIKTVNNGKSVINDNKHRDDNDNDDDDDIEKVIKANANSRWIKERTAKSVKLKENVSSTSSNANIDKKSDKCDVVHSSYSKINVSSYSSVDKHLHYTPTPPSAATAAISVTVNNTNTPKKEKIKHKIKLPYINIKQPPLTPQWSATASSSFAKTFSGKAHDCIPFTATSLTYSEIHNAQSYISPSTQRAVDKQIIEQLHGKGNVFKVSKTVPF